jgi:hypothetical protein
MGAIKMKVFILIMGLCFCQASFSARIHAEHQFGKATAACEIGKPTITKSIGNGSTTFLFG